MRMYGRAMPLTVSNIGRFAGLSIAVAVISTSPLEDVLRAACWGWGKGVQEASRPLVCSRLRSCVYLTWYGS